MDDSLVSRYNSYLAPFKQRLKEFKKFTPRAVKTKMKKKIVYNNAKKLYSILPSIYYNDYNDITDEENGRMGKKYNPKNLLIEGESFIESKKEDEEKSKLQPKKLLLKEEN